MDFLILFLLGICVGSFLNVVIYRLRNNDSAMRGRSYCDHCKKPISWLDNIPLFSYLVLGGKSRCCHKTILIDYPLVELLSGLQFVWVYWLLKVNFNFFGQLEGFYSFGLLIYWLILFAGSLTIAVFDFKYMLIPDKVLWVMAVAAGGRLLVTHQWEYLLIGLLSGLFLWSLKTISKGKMGDGDIYLGVVMGLVLGWPQILVAFFLAFLTGASAGVILILLSKKKLKDKIAFGPFLLLGMLIAKMWGWAIWQGYMQWLI